MANINKEKKYHFIYKTTNLLNGKYYVGMHSTSNLKDGYLGSGKRLRYSIRKYGASNFKCEILEFFASREKLASRERELINESLLKDSLCLNLQPGGGGGVSKEVGLALSKAGTEATRKLRESQDKVYLEKRKQVNEATKLRNKILWETGAFNMHYGHTYWVGRKHKPETIENFRTQKRGTGTGNTNSQYGSFWITDDKVNKKLKAGEAIPEGFKKGRKLN